VFVCEACVNREAQCIVLVSNKLGITILNRNFETLRGCYGREDAGEGDNYLPRALALALLRGVF